MNVRAIVVSLVAGVLTVVLLLVYLRQLEIETAGGGPVMVLAAVKPIEPGTIIEPDMLVVKTIPQAYVEGRAVRKADMARVIGLKVETAVKAQQTVMWTDLAVTTDDRRQLSGLVQPGMRAVGVRAANDDVHFGLIRPGDRVDVVANLPQPSNEKERVAVLVAQNVLVLAVGLDTGARDVVGPRQAGERVDQVLTVALNPHQLQQLSLAAERGKLTVGVRHPDDTRALESLPDLPERSLFNAQEAKPRAMLAPAKPTALVPTASPPPSYP